LFKTFTDAKECVEDTSSLCKCKVKGGEEVDLSDLFKNAPLSTTDSSKGDTYTFDSCKAVPCTSTCTANGCVGCQTTSGKDKFGLGLLSSVKFDLTGSANKWVLKATYTGGDGGRRMIVSFNFADKASPKTSFTNEQPELNYNLVVEGKYAVYTPEPTPTTSPSSGGGVDPGVVGIVLIVLLILCAVGYLVVGIIIQAGVRGARGVEVIPNLSFWKDFPFLLKDGFIFTFTCPCLRKNTSGYTPL
jgi:hypothetical protein